MLDLVAAVNDDVILANNLMRSRLVTRANVKVHLQRGYPSAALAFREAMRNSEHDVVVFAHQDVYLPDGWEMRLFECIERIEAVDPAWAVLGIYGVTANGTQVGRVWSSGLGAVFGQPFDAPVPVASIDEVLIVLRRSSGVAFDPAMPGYHLYATDLVQTALASGRSAYAICAPVVHNSRPVLYLGRDYFRAYDFVVRKWRDKLPIHNNVAFIVGPGLDYLRLRARHRFNELRYRGVDRNRLAVRRDCVGIARQLGFE